MNSLSRPLSRLLRTLIVTVAASFSASAIAATYSNIVVFGDSLSDPGNFFAKTAIPGVIPGFPPPPYVNGHFSNGLTAPEYVAAYAQTNFGISTANFAEGGATTGTININNGRCVVPSAGGCLAAVPSVGLGLQQEITNYLATTPVIAPGTLFFVQGGGNNFFLDAAIGGTANIFAIPTDLQTAVVRLAGAGAQNIVLQNLPDLSRTPYGVGLGAVGQAQVAGAVGLVNAGIAQIWAGLSGIVTGFDTFSFLNQIIANPLAFGITNASTPCITSAVALAANCAGYLFFDDVHPTTYVHQLFSQQLIAVARIPEPSTLALFAVVSFALAMTLRRRRLVRVQAK
ncbi:MAG: SGNH/GDSL hydrolase family protein [Burkholderiales bacterium]